MLVTMSDKELHRVNVTQAVCEKRLMLPAGVCLRCDGSADASALRGN